MNEKEQKTSVHNVFHGQVTNAIIGSVKCGGNFRLGDSYSKKKKEHKKKKSVPEHTNVVYGDIDVEGDYYLGDPKNTGKFVKQTKKKD